MRHDKWDELVESSSLFCGIKNEGSEVDLIRHYLPPRRLARALETQLNSLLSAIVARDRFLCIVNIVIILILKIRLQNYNFFCEYKGKK